jgi:Arc/MetJ-type ribon-helix-helix transcriptional regulator
VHDQVDAAREALGQQLAQMTDTLVMMARQRFADAAAQVQAALRTAAERAASSAAEAQLREAALAGREAALQHALNLLDGAEPPP